MKMKLQWYDIYTSFDNGEEEQERAELSVGAKLVDSELNSVLFVCGKVSSDTANNLVPIKQSSSHLKKKKNINLIIQKYLILFFSFS